MRPCMLRDRIYSILPDMMELLRNRLWIFRQMAKYTGTTSSTYATGYTVTADYIGQVSKTNCSVLTYTAIFGSMEVPEEQTDQAPADTPSSENTNGAAAELDIKQPLLIGGAVLLLTAGGVFLFKRYKGRS